MIQNIHSIYNSLVITPLNDCIAYSLRHLEFLQLQRFLEGEDGDSMSIGFHLEGEGVPCSCSKVLFFAFRVLDRALVAPLVFIPLALEEAGLFGLSEANRSLSLE